MRRWLIALAVVILLSVNVACGSPVPSVACAAVLTPDAALLAETETAAARWSAPTGCDIRVGEGGVPVLAQDRVFVVPDGDGERVADADPLAQGSEKCAVAIGDLGVYVGWRVIVATAPRVFCPSLQTAIAHEMGHVLIAADEHSGSGLMRGAAADGSLIDTSSLALICASFPCATFAPES